MRKNTTDRIPRRRLLPALMLVIAFLAGTIAEAQNVRPGKEGRRPGREGRRTLRPEAGGNRIGNPFESNIAPVPANQIDKIIEKELRKRKITPAPPCSDEVFMRRACLDVTGTLPEPEQVRLFLRNTDPGKRAALIERLLEEEEFSEYWALKWCDLLRVKAEFPINLWPNAVQAYHRWIRDSIRDNKPYDQFVRELLTASGSNFRVPPANFFRAVQGREPSGIAAAVALNFMGVRFENWQEERREGMAAFFSRIKYKKTGEWKEEIVCLDPALIDPLVAVFPDGSRVTIAGGDDPRPVFADWLIKKKNPWFARNITNRIWAWLLGRGIIHEPDDIRPDNPPVFPGLLTCLEEELIRADYDLKAVYRLILNSRTYQQSSIPHSNHPEAEALFAHYAVRRLDAEVLIDALCWISGTREAYSSAIPEPFTYIPEEHRTISLEDGSITSQFLEMFGRPARDTGLEEERNNEPTETQLLHLLNSTHIQQKIEKSRRLRNIMKTAREKRQSPINALYLTILSRPATQAELAAVQDYVQGGGAKMREAAIDLAWALINSKEFLYRH
jgi:hypothetical protein